MVVRICVVATPVVCHVKYTEKGERKKELEALAFKTINGTVELAGCCLESSLWGGLEVILRRLSVLNPDQKCEIRYATPLMTRSYAVL